MAHALSTSSLRDFFVAHAPAGKRRSLFARFIAAMQTSRQRQAEREIARYMQGRGDKFTDEMERDIERRFLNSSSGW